MKKARCLYIDDNDRVFRALDLITTPLLITVIEAEAHVDFNAVELP